ncbi:MAG: M20/M25/M40 family metallo-hydrolase [Ktedonobacteraceae bacterium]|nr:M20/M25/M40 family metallo-hydrolase [Ktedonobacteraceae bacterium]MBO0792567.1 M20/M25/M40 family metallo-hydrolase [Ktedonobacteraceae bacterium]
MSLALSELRRKALEHVEPVVELTQRICAIPSPTGDEFQRAEFVASLMRQRGYQPEMDEIGNVYVRRGARGTGPVLMLLAHTDTVFPAGTPLKIERDGDVVRGPGIGDNCLSVASMVHLLDMLDELGHVTDVDIVAVANVGEEGLGNLRGARAAVERYRSDLGAVIAIDGRFGSIVNAAVGSRRWRISVHGPGGHSFGSFGSPSAIHGLGRIIADIAALEVPREPKTTFNVGVIEGGTSVNTIAPIATALLDMRSVDVAALDRLTEQARAIVERSAGPGLRAEIEVLGERPAGRIALDAPLVQLATECLRWLGTEPRYTASSTDANIPLSLKIPAVCVGVTHSERTHTVEEWLSIPPIGNGLSQLLRLSIEACALLARG